MSNPTIQLNRNTIIDPKHRISILPIPYCGDVLLKKTFEKLLLSETSSLDSDWMNILIVRDPVDRLYEAFVDHCILGKQFSHLTFAEFSAPFVTNHEAPWTPTFKSQTSYLHDGEEQFNWIVPYEKIPLLMTALEKRIGTRISPKQETPRKRFGHFNDPRLFREMTAKELSKQDRLPAAHSIAGEQLAESIRDAYAEDSQLHQRSCSEFPSLSNSREQQIFRNLRQVSSKTSLDRYPTIFQSVANRLQGRKPSEIKIASYGCSSGEECFSLRKYFPSAEIHGFDLRERNLNLARKRNTDDDIHFHFSTPETLSQHGTFDAIFAMSVFCRWPDAFHSHRCEELYSFEEFTTDIELLDSVLKAGGLLSVYNAMFRFTDLEIARNYQTVSIPAQTESGFVTKFSPQNQRLAEQDYPFTVFEKRQP